MRNDDLPDSPRPDDQPDSPHPDDDAFEVTSLQPRAPSAPTASGRTARAQAAQWRGPLRLVRRISSRGWRLLAAGVALAVTLAIILGMIPGVAQAIAGTFGHSQGARTPAPSNQSSYLSISLQQGPTGPTPTPNATPNPAAGSFPHSCPGGVTRMSTATPFTGTVGAGPVWFGSFQSGVGQPAAITLTQLQARANQYGLPIQVVLYIRSDTHGPVTLSGADLDGGRPLWFSFVAIGNGHDPSPAAQAPATTFAFTPQRASPNIPTFWYGSYGMLYLPGAGCYAISAHWPGGGWHATVVAAA